MINTLKRAKKQPTQRDNGRDVAHSAQLAAADEDSSFVKHASIQMQHVIHIHCYKILCQISLQIHKKNHISFFNECQCVKWIDELS